MSFEYKIVVLDLKDINVECNALGSSGWEIAAVYPTVRSNCCNQNVSSAVVFFKRPK